MQIACPACHTRYTVPDTAIGAHGRTVRCAKCRHSWYQPGHDEVVEDELAGDEVANRSEQTAAAQPAEAEPAAEPVAAREKVAETVAADGDWHASPPAPRGWADHADAPDYADTQTPDPVAASPVDETVEPEPVIEDEPVAHRAPAFAAPGAEPIDAEYEDLDRPAETSRWKRLLIICGILLVLAAALIYGAVRYFGAPAWLPEGAAHVYYEAAANCPTGGSCSPPAARSPIPAAGQSMSRPSWWCCAIRRSESSIAGKWNRLRQSLAPARASRSARW